MRHYAILESLSVAVLLVGVADSAWAQSSGMFGSRSVGSGTVTGGTRSFSGGSASGGLGGGGGNVGIQNQADVGSVTGNERFNRNSRAANAFVGADSGDTTTPFSQAGSQNGGFGGLGGLEQLSQLRNGQFGQQQGQFGQGQFGQQGNNGRGSQRAVPTAMKIAFVPPAHAAEVVSTRLSARLAKAASIQRVGNLEVAMQGRTAILRGTVLSEHDRDLAEQLVLLEPGVSVVQNELVLAPPPEELPTESTLLPPARN